MTKPHEVGGLGLSRIASSLTIAAVMVLGILWTIRRDRHAPPTTGSAVA